MNPEFEPSDWTDTAVPKLAQLDSLQRCLICKDFLKAPVMTSCNHIFCSQCIRQHLITVSQCPLCKTEQFESNLKRVILLEEIVSCFQSIRPGLIELLAKRESEPTTKDKQILRSETPEIIEILEHSDSDALPNSVPCPVCNVKMDPDFLQRKHLDDCLLGRKSVPSAKRKLLKISLFFQPRAKQPKQEINHLDFYFDQVHKHHHETKRMPKIDFASLSTPKLKDKLAHYKLSTTGTRAQMELRYNQFYLLYNSNLDSNRPVLELELRQNLNRWEKSHAAFSTLANGGSIFGDALSSKLVSDKDFPLLAWQQKYRKEFSRLIRKARASHTSNRERKIAESSQISLEQNGILPHGVVAPKSEMSERASPNVETSIAPEQSSSVSEPTYDFADSMLF